MCIIFIRVRALLLISFVKKIGLLINNCKLVKVLSECDVKCCLAIISEKLHKLYKIV